VRLDLQEKQVLTDWMFQHHLGISPRPPFVELKDGLNVLATQMSQEFGNFTQEEWYNRVVHFYNNNISKTGHRARLGNFIRQAEHIGQDVTQAEILGLYEAGQLHDFELICLRRSAWFSSRAPNPFNPGPGHHVAFYMGRHARLGQNSPLIQLDDLITGEIAHLAFGFAEVPPLTVQEEEEFLPATLLATPAAVGPSAHEALYSAPVATPQVPEAGQGDLWDVFEAGQGDLWDVFEAGQGDLWDVFEEEEEV